MYKRKTHLNPEIKGDHLDSKDHYLEPQIEKITQPNLKSKIGKFPRGASNLKNRRRATWSLELNQICFSSFTYYCL